MASHIKDDVNDALGIYLIRLSSQLQTSTILTIFEVERETTEQVPADSPSSCRPELCPKANLRCRKVSQGEYFFFFIFFFSVSKVEAGMEEGDLEWVQ